MSTQHSQTIADHLLATGEQMVIEGKAVVGKKRLLTFTESRELNLHPRSIAYRISAPKSGFGFVPAKDMRVDVDGVKFILGDCRDLGAYYRFDIWRNVG